MVFLCFSVSFNVFVFLKRSEQIMTPLKFTGLLGKVDIECRTMHEEYTKHWSEDVLPFPTQVRRLGAASQAGAIRYGLSLALKSFVDRDTVEKMRLGKGCCVLLCTFLWYTA